MKLPKALTTVTPFSKHIALSLFVILPFTTFWLGYNAGINSTSIRPVNTTNSSPATTSIDIHKTLTYTLPSDWQSITPKDTFPNQLFVESKSFQVATLNHKGQGAGITILVYANPQFKSSKEILVDLFQKAFMQKNIHPMDIKIGNQSGSYQKVSYESISYEYVVTNDKYIWEMSFGCNNVCTQQDLQNRDDFLNSLIFKE
jgi:hypothetical protein